MAGRPVDDAGVDPLLPRPSGARKATKMAPSKPHDEPSMDALLAKKLVELGHYRDDVRARRYESLTLDEIRTQFGADMLPIFVPLAHGESSRMYEERFVDWLRRERHPSLREMKKYRDYQLERRLRIKFADLNVDRVERFEPPRDVPRKRERERSRERDRDRHRSRSRSRSRERSSRDSSESSERNRRQRRSLDRERPGTASKRPRLSHSGDGSGGSGEDCRVKIPSTANATIAQLVAAYVACACRACLMNAVSRMATRVCELEGQIQGGCHQSNARNDHVADITRDDDRQSPPADTTVATSGSSTADAITRLVLSSQSLVDNAPVPAATAAPLVNAVDDPVEQQLAAAYDVLNKRIAVNEKTLSASTARLTDAPVTDMDELAQLHDEKDALATTIARDSQRRVAALAALAVYVWRHDRAELHRMVSDADASNVSYVQTVSHHKCAQLAHGIAEKRVLATEIRAQLETTVDGDNGTSESARLEELQRLGKQLSATEKETEELLAQRRRELATLIRFDEPLRHTIQQQLALA